MRYGPYVFHRKDTNDYCVYAMPSRAAYKVTWLCTWFSYYVDVHIAADYPWFYVTVKALEAISTKLKNLDWKIDESFCSGAGGINRTVGKFLSNVTCDCSLQNGNVCSITTIQLKGLNLIGTLPAEFGNLTNLRELFMVTKINNERPVFLG
ncbi:hypothetical protein CJ030_MR4G029202 [Morella rubra]|uniref:LRR receptor-like serine/threonine-protein kinase n=1 Tax=Morella rubra TaxID=262757 RepID=A0A6A1VTZ7_9ROSI|nr:hypothetical protein CJ030_MR4G029202 [Morella rubra]